ncbi:MAG: TetR/AcrR family transcriptional regulator [Burkholderiaceae bacterium]
MDQKVDTKSLIIKQAAKLFARGDYTGTSIHDIAHAVGISKPALYHHFSDKEEIYFEIVNPVLRDMCENAEAVGANGKPAAEQLRDFMLVHVRYVEQNNAACAASQVAFRSLTEPAKRESALQWRDRHEAVLRRILERGVSDGTLQIAEVNAAARMILTILNGFTLWYRPAGPMRAEAFADMYFNLLMQGLQPRQAVAEQPAPAAAGAAKAAAGEAPAPRQRGTGGRRGAKGL